MNRLNDATIRCDTVSSMEEGLVLSISDTVALGTEAATKRKFPEGVFNGSQTLSHWANDRIHDKSLQSMGCHCLCNLSTWHSAGYGVDAHWTFSEDMNTELAVCGICSQWRRLCPFTWLGAIYIAESNTRAANLEMRMYRDQTPKGGMSV